VSHTRPLPLPRLAAIALLVLEDEESAFWCLVAVVETILPADYYSKTLTASQVSQEEGMGHKCQKKWNLPGLPLSGTAECLFCRWGSAHVTDWC
jgi:hypothetical protein